MSGSIVVCDGDMLDGNGMAEQCDMKFRDVIEFHLMVMQGGDWIAIVQLSRVLSLQGWQWEHICL